MTTSIEDSKDIKVLVLPEGDYYVAICLDYGFAVQAKTMLALKERFENMLKAFALLSKEHGEEPFSNLEPAPIEYWRQWENADRNFCNRMLITWPECDWSEHANLPQHYELQSV